MPETFTEQERKILEPFFTNLDQPVFCLINLPEVIKGAVFSRYSRSSKSLRRTLLDDFIKDPKMEFAEIVGNTVGSGVDLSRAVQKAEAFYDRVLVGYGDDSVADLAGAHIGCEGVSNIVSKVLEDARLTSPLEKSTRYVWFDQKQEGEYLFYKEPAIVRSQFAEAYVRLMHLLFDTYAQLKEPLVTYIQQRLGLDDFQFKDPEGGDELTFRDVRDPVKRKQAEVAYRSAVRAAACDCLRGLLPAATRTNVGIFADGRSFEYLLTKLYSSEFTEARELASQMHRELNKVIPSFVKRAKPSQYLTDTRAALKRWGEVVPPAITCPTHQDPSVRLDWCSPEAEVEVITAILFPISHLSYAELRRKAKGMTTNERRKVLTEALQRRTNRRDKPGRAFENVSYRFEIVADYGIYRDLQRHRMLTQDRQVLTVRHGYTVPSELREAGLQGPFDRCMAQAAEVYEQIYTIYPIEAQYVVPLAFHIRWYMYMNLRELFHFAELRTGKQGHPAYRKVAQRMYTLVKETHPLLVEWMKYVDLNDYPLGRGDAEVRTEAKRTKLEHVS
ncbi:MAG: FAD-dependent thymidylate synthase [Elusimicrobia bacterium]|nr:FAD-dependent thymidylate synthase [Elusimicrobiota bacterium]